MRLILFLLTALFALHSWAPQIKLRGLRIDTGYFYNRYPGLTPAEISHDIVTKARASAVNTLFIYAYNTVYGALYRTDYPDTKVESGFGKLNILRELTTVAKKNGLRVVAVVPVNNFKEVWEKKPEWRAKTIRGNDYIPAKDAYLLSAWHPEFRTWLAGFYRDLLMQNPGIDGVEAVEPLLDYRWKQETDYNPVATQIFRSRYRGSVLGDRDWLNFRAQGLTDLIGILNTAAHDFGKASYLVQTWPVKPDGHLYSAAVIKDNTGLDLDGILNLTGPKKLTYIMGEFMWQQWAAEYGPEKFPVWWTRSAAQEFIGFVNQRSAVLIHVELSTFHGSYGTVRPTLKEFSQVLKSVRDLKAGLEVYDHNQITQLDAWDELFNWRYWK